MKKFTAKGGGGLRLFVALKLMTIEFPPESIFSSFQINEETGLTYNEERFYVSNIVIVNNYDANGNTRLDIGETITLSYWDLDQKSFGTFTGLEYAGFTVGSNNDLVFTSENAPGYFTAINTTGVLYEGVSLVSASSVTCFLPETLIRLANNQQKQAGDLVVGDLVATPAGPQAVKFIGKTTRNIFDLSETGRMPIRIEAGSLGELGPDADIHCTPSHAFHIKGSLVEAQALVNGATIQQLNDWDELLITYISIELEDHQLIWANGLLTETYYANWRNDGFSRQSWDNYDQYLELYGESESMNELDMPRIPFARQLPAELRLMLQLNESAKALQAV